ncbi:copper amine oxidase N-terminal domain-containing protein [Pseudobacteroides cellulosolvens]|uniref:Copper amine oxidase-like domain-containing protein n=1 Tax=Pseudobacteroides cellulosolvens ATCC 35603 = DSM 2933 TaxID=398512 RepID=A0A0L6JMN5_9FIRM|nr:copper amine oxidase N-terminal domain-containing protein [Pseudobacteroides cellulosolvens]KNY27025.1 copper amine oxidase-like domain-containing protein [Pseudobacteroides cellulosolvens ATCC 35603 = DSM 2933]
MKKFLTIMTTCLIAGGVAVTSFAAGKITESPDIKIAIDGKIGRYTDVPIMQDGRTLLPLRAVLEKLGVQNDDSHIIWEPQEKSITINKDSKKIFLQVGNKKAQVDESSFELDVPPVIYKSRTYIPARFVAESLGKKVVWDGKTKSVLIKEPASFNEVKEILAKSEAAMKNVNKAKMNIKMDVKESAKESASTPISVSMSGDMKIEMDKTSKVAHMLMDMKALGMSITMEYYYDKDTQYMKGFLFENWVKTKSEKENFDTVINKELGMNMIAADDVGSAGLVKIESDNPDEIVLQGAAFFGSLSNLGSSLMGEESTTDSDEIPANYSVKVILDSKTYIMKSCIMEIDESNDGSAGDEPEANGSFSITLSDINGDFTVKIPDEVIKNAKDASEMGNIFNN